MSEKHNQTYEGLFLFPQAAAANLQAAKEHLDELLARAGAEVLSMRKWDERRLAYENKGNKRGVYFLVYFNVPGGNLSGLERDCNLSEHMLRALITRADHVLTEQIQAAEGRDQLADEIKLHSEQSAGEKKEVPDEEAKAEPEKPADEPVVVTAMADPEPSASPDAPAPELDAETEA